MAAVPAEIWAPPGPPVRGRGGEAGGGVARGTERPGPGRRHRLSRAQVCGIQGRAGRVPNQRPRPFGRPEPPLISAESSGKLGARRERRGGAAGCHLGDARHLLLPAALSSSSPSSCHRKCLPPLPKVGTGKDLLSYAPLLHHIQRDRGERGGCK